MRIVAASYADISALSVLATQAFSETFAHLYSKEDLDYHLDHSCSEAFFRAAIEAGDCVLLAYVGEALAGYAKFGALGLPVVASDAMELHRLYIIKPYQGTGVAHALMQAVMFSPAMQRASAIYLGVWEDNFKAQAFYARYGFVAVGEYTYYVGKHADRELILKKDCF